MIMAVACVIHARREENVSALGLCEHLTACLAEDKPS
jgi:hypothetical protein